ncbi:MAG: sensor domain-containing diguanylate cyclase [Motiliproteus sp.]
MFKHNKRLAWSVSLLLIFGFLATSLASYFISRNSLQAQIADHELPLTSDNIYSDLQRDLLRPVFISSLMASDTFLRDWIIEGENEHKSVLRYLNEIKQRYGTFTSFVVSEKSRNYYHAGQLLKQVHPDDPRDAWYFRVQQMDSDYEINVDLDAANNDAMTVFVNYRIFDYDGDYLGATGVGLTVDAMRSLIDRYQATYDRRILFVDKTGSIMLRTNGVDEQAATLAQMEGLASLIAPITATDSGSFQYQSQGVTHLVASRYIPELDWYLLVEQSDEVPMTGIRQTLIINLLVCTLITLVILWLTHRTIRSYQNELSELASTDKLTGLYNRQAFDILYQQTVRDMRRIDGPMSVIFFDIDHLKSVNDRYGHLMGDRVIRHITGLAQSCLRRSDLTCRWGGDEILILLRECDAEYANTMAEKIRLEITDNPLTTDGAVIDCSISLGVAQFNGEPDQDSFLLRADSALYAAKNAGRNLSVKAV